MTVEALINFHDIENNKQLRKKGEQFEVSEKRGNYLISRGVAKQVTVKLNKTEK